MNSFAILPFLLFTFCLSCSSQTLFFGTEKLISPLATDPPILVGLSTWGDIRKSHTSQREPFVSTWACPAPDPLIEESYKDLIQAIWQKGCADIKRSSSAALNVLKHYYQRTVDGIQRTAKKVFEIFLWILIGLWLKCFSVLLNLTWVVLRLYAVPVILLSCLALLTSLLYQAVLWICGKLPWFIIAYPLKTIWKALKYRKSSVVLEKSVEGFKTIEIPMTPPGKSSLLISYEDGSHAGYATCVKLYNGRTALLTATHCVSPGALVCSTVGQHNKIKLLNFEPVFADKTLDAALFYGPPNWEGAMECKAAQIAPASNLTVSPACFYRYVDGAWRRRNAQIQGRHGLKATVLSDTEAGDSGSAYWNGKTVLGVHIGYVPEFNFNLMTPLPILPGLTIPTYVYETTAPQGRIFESEVVQALEKQALLYKPRGLDWAMSEEDDFYADKDWLKNLKKNYQLEVKPSTPAKSQNSGNEERSAVCKSTVPPSNIPSKLKGCGNSASVKATPSAAIATTSAVSIQPPLSVLSNIKTLERGTTCSSTPVVDVKEEMKPLQPPQMDHMIDRIVKALMDRVDLANIEKQVVEKLSEKAMKKAPRQRNRGKRGGQKKPEISQPSSTQSTAGKKEGPVPPQASKSAVKSPDTTIPNLNLRPNGGKSFANNTQNWQRKPQVSAGHSLAPKQS